MQSSSMETSNVSSRRRFLHTTGAAGAALTAQSWNSLIRGQSPSNRIRVGVIGTGVRGKYLIGNLPEIGEQADLEGYLVSVTRADERSVQEVRFLRVSANQAGSESSGKS